jgi:nucleoside-diphosphate-sugar epimerase
MKVLFIGGTGIISMAITRQLSKLPNFELYLLNRGNRNTDLPSNVKIIQGDINNEQDIASKIEKLSFDAVCNFIAFVPKHLERDYNLFKNKTKQYIFISSASAYQKPLSNYLITEGSPMANPYWEYSRNKIACEDFLMKKYREDKFPVTIVRPSHTYDERSVPLGVHGKNGSWQVIKRMQEGKPVIIHGDGTTLWTMTHNSDFAKAFIGLLGNVHALGETFHITSDESLTWNQIYQSIANALGVELKACHVSSEFLHAVGPQYDFLGSLVGDKANSVVFDNSKVKRAVPGFVATKRFDQGVKETIDFILKNKEYQKEDPDFDKWCDKVVEARENAIKNFK